MKYILIMVTLFSSLTVSAQNISEAELVKVMNEKDSIMFQQGFNNCNIPALEKLISEKFEFYHDKGGITNGKTAFVNSIRNNICSLKYKAIRKLVPGTMEVYPLYNNGKLYGAIQSGRHEFWALEPGKPEYKTGIARFTHLWLIENGEWKFARGLSYDHLAASN
jgi:hypothetical protein